MAIRVNIGEQYREYLLSKNQQWIALAWELQKDQKKFKVVKHSGL